MSAEAVKARRTWTTLRTKVSENDNGLLSLFDRSSLDGLHESLLSIKDSTCSLEVQTLLSGDLGDGTARSQVSSKDSIVQPESSL